MLSFFLIFVFLSYNLDNGITNANPTNGYYCKVEETLCTVPNTTHVGCVRNRTHESPSIDSKPTYAPPYSTVDLTTDHVLRILDTFNTIRSHLALIMKTANNEIVNWDSEFQFLAEFSIRKSNYGSGMCAATEQHQNAEFFSVNNVMGIRTEYDEAVAVNDLVNHLYSYLTDYPSKIASHVPTIFKKGAISKIGCGFGILYNHDNRTIHYTFRCIYNDENIYNILGPACSKCGVPPTTVEAECNIFYPGLCGHLTFPSNILNNNILENVMRSPQDRSHIGEHQRKDDDDDDDDVGKSAVDFVLWFLGAILLFGLLVSCAIKIRKVAMRRSSESQEVVVSEKLYRDRDDANRK